MVELLQIPIVLFINQMKFLYSLHHFFRPLNWLIFSMIVFIALNTLLFLDIHPQLLSLFKHRHDLRLWGFVSLYAHWMGFGLLLSTQGFIFNSFFKGKLWNQNVRVILSSLRANEMCTYVKSWLQVNLLLKFYMLKIYSLNLLIPLGYLLWSYEFLITNMRLQSQSLWLHKVDVKLIGVILSTCFGTKRHLRQRWRWQLHQLV